MKKPIFTALSPNAQRDDIWLAFKLLFQPRKWQKGFAVKELENEFAQWLPAKYVFTFESGRTSLYALLKALGVGSEDEVLLQAYTCVAVPEPILWIGARPVYVDCDENLQMSLEDLERKITPQSKVLILQHTFGFPANIGAVLALARQYNLTVLEDCAHAMGAKYQGKQVGTFGEASFFSFGRDKVLSSVFGGLIATNSDRLAEKLRTFHENCPYPSHGWIRQQLVHPVLLGLVKATYRFYIGGILLKIFKGLHLISKAVYAEERKGEKPPFIFKKMPNALATLALHQFEKLDRYNKHRLQIAKKYEALKSLPVVLPQFGIECEPVVLRYTLQVSEPKVLIKKALQEAIYLGDWYTTAIAPEGVHYDKIHYNPSDCPAAENLARTSVNLPTHIGVTEKDADRIVDFLRKFYGV